MNYFCNQSYFSKF